MTDNGDALSQAITARNPELAGKVHLVNGRPWCDGVNHTTMCDPRFEAPGLQVTGATICLSHVHLDAGDGEARPVTLHCARQDPHRLHSDEDHGIWWADVDEVEGDDPREAVAADRERIKAALPELIRQHRSDLLYTPPEAYTERYGDLLARLERLIAGDQ